MHKLMAAIQLFRQSCIYAALLGVSGLICIPAAPLYAQTSAQFFGLHMNSAIAVQPPPIWGQPWPVIPFGTVRLWDAGVFWSRVNPKSGVYDWSVLDEWFDDAQKFDVKDLMYTFGKTPQWASSHPDDLTCTPNWNAGECDPPNDLNPDGTGSDEHWKTFVAAIATHANGRIRYWEIWNEPIKLQHWTGTIAQVVRMAKDARAVILSVDPNAVLLTPSSRGSWQASYFAAGGANYADVITYHGYIQTDNCATASDELSLINKVRQTMSAYRQGSKPLWDTEASWGATANTCFSGNQDLQAGFLAQMYLLHWSSNVRRFYWYMYNNELQGTLWKPNPNNPSGPGTLLAGGIAYRQLNKWLLGSTIIRQCTVTGTLWNCAFSRPNGYTAEVLWDTSQTCANTSCTTIGRKVSSQYSFYETLTGSKQAISGDIVPVGLKPVLVENQ